MMSKVKSFLTSERGDTNFISIIIIVAIVVALAGAFWALANGGMKTISKAFNKFLKSVK